MPSTPEAGQMTRPPRKRKSYEGFSAMGLIRGSFGGSVQFHLNPEYQAVYGLPS
jgi:hypothetical protein